MSNTQLGQSLLILHMHRMEQYGGLEKDAGALDFLRAGVSGLKGIATNPGKNAKNFIDLFRNGGAGAALGSYAPQLAAGGAGALGLGALLYGGARLGSRLLGRGAAQTATQTAGKAALGDGLKAWWKAQPLVNKGVLGLAGGGAAMGTTMGVTSGIFGGRR